MSESLDKIRRDYGESLPKKLASLQHAWQDFDKDPSTLGKLYDLVHRLTGSSGMYGYLIVHEHAQALDSTIRQALSDATPDISVATERDAITRQYQALLSTVEKEIEQL